MSGPWGNIDALRQAHEEELRQTKSAIDSIPSTGGKWTFRGVSALGKWRATHRYQNPVEATSGERLVDLVREVATKKKGGTNV